jgi:hypothetical protein
MIYIPYHSGVKNRSTLPAELVRHRVYNGELNTYLTDSQLDAPFSVPYPWI